MSTPPDVPTVVRMTRAILSAASALVLAAFYFFLAGLPTLPIA
jgi:hypothetical protein